MKKLTFLFIMLLTSVLGHGQATDLVINNQTPGWLSSKINFSDQQTVRNLKVTGYINDTDLKFIGTLIQSRNLDEEIDLSDCHIVSSVSGGEDDVLTGFGLASKDTVRVYRIPKSVANVVGCTANLYVDTLYFDCKMKYLDCQCFNGENTDIGSLVVGNNTDSIPGQNLINSRTGVGFSFVKLKSIQLPKTMKVISDLAFYGSSLKEINLKDLVQLKYIGSWAFCGSNYSPDTLWLNAKEVQLSAFVKRFGSDLYIYGDNIYISKNCENIVSEVYGKYHSRFRDNSIIHMESDTPPSGEAPNSTCTVYVPKGAKSKYLQSNWKNANIIEINPVEKITLGQHSVTLNRGETIPLSATILPADADDPTISWKSHNQSVAIVNGSGVVTAVNPGKTKIFAISNATGIQDSCLVIVRKNVSNIEFVESEVILENVGSKKMLVLNVYPEDATDQSIIWSSSNEQVCTVNNDGLVTASGPGATIVTATTVDGGLTATCAVKVLQHVENVSLEKGELMLQVGDTGLLRATVMPASADDKTLLWSSSNLQVSTVDASGNVTALIPGEIWIKAVSKDNPEAKDSCKVTVVQPVLGITVSQSNCTLNNIGERIQLEATVFPEDASNKKINWSSSNTSVCVVSNGLVVATGFGTAMVIATTEDGNQMAFCSVTVEEATEEYSFTIKQIESGSVSTKVKKGSPFTVTFNVEEGWKIHSVSLNNEDCTDQISADYTLTIEKVMSDCLLNVVYEQSLSAMKSVRSSDVKIFGTAIGARVTDVPEGTAILVYSEDGVLLKSLMANGSHTDIPLTAGGIYIIKVEEKIIKLKH